MAIKMPPEWAPQEWLWIGFPHDPGEWPGTLAKAQEQIAAFANAVAKSGQEVRLLVRNADNASVAKRLVSQNVKLEAQRYGDVWLRDTGPLMVFDDSGQRSAQLFGFNGWGGKYPMDGDQEVGQALARSARLPFEQADWILEGGAIDNDGCRLAVTTEQCLLNPNRNPRLTREDIEAKLHSALGLNRILWLGEGLQGDHTDGHVDNLARFIAPGTLAIPRADETDDPNAVIYTDARMRARAFGLDVVDIPSPGRLTRDGDIIPASYMNFVITNHLLVVPQFDVTNDQAALEVLATCFPKHEMIGLSADALLSGGGAFHCASQQMPAA